MFRRIRYFIYEKKDDILLLLKVTIKKLYWYFSTKYQYWYLIIGKLGRRCEGAGVGEGDLSKWNQGKIIEIS